MKLLFAAAHARLLSQISALRKDPFDHMLLAQAAGEGVAVATMDRDLLAYSRNLKGLQLV